MSAEKVATMCFGLAVVFLALSFVFAFFQETIAAVLLVFFGVSLAVSFAATTWDML